MLQGVRREASEVIFNLYLHPKESISRFFRFLRELQVYFNRIEETVDGFMVFRIFTYRSCELLYYLLLILFWDRFRTCSILT